MALCLAESLIEKNGFDLENQLSKYSKWMREGYLSSNGHCFDIGGTTSRAIRDYDRYGEVIAYNDARSLGNGSIMRLAPVPMFYANNRTEAILIL
jgi:ADP-ribosylglycohydrolase